MITVNAKQLSVTVDAVLGEITSVKLCGRERAMRGTPLFRLCLRDGEGNAVLLCAKDAAKREEHASLAVFDGFLAPDGSAVSARVEISLCEEAGEIVWHACVKEIDGGHLVEWIDVPLVTLPRLEKNSEDGSGGKILYPYNEGAIVDDMEQRDSAWFPYEEPAYPSKGAFGVFPNMVCSQMLAYLWEDAGLYMGAHDARRAVKGIDFYSANGGVCMQMRLYCGVDCGESFVQDYPIVWSAVGARWESAADRYRAWNEQNLPRGAKRVRDNESLPAWYRDVPLVLTYPVRGVHDTDTMTPNRMYPYINALPTVERIKARTGARIMTVLMHWEGTAPWAPPYVWPPYGGEETLAAFRDALHKEGNLLGVYCSGFGYTLQSNLVEEYNREGEYAERGLAKGMCESPAHKVEISRICTAQRKGVDICPASETGRALLFEAYTPLFESGIDYAQILDQNHGGGQYFCYSRDHGHPPAPGVWMTEAMQEMLGQWNEKAPSMLFGCESAAAEPFIGNLLMSDNRFELNYHLGRAVPLYAYLYHEYLYNFMGNQVCSPFDECDDRSLWYRIAYAFAAGDSITLVLDQDGNPKSRWGNIETDYVPDGEKVLTLVANLSCVFRENLKEHIFGARMTATPHIDCDTVTLYRKMEGLASKRDCVLPAVISTAWECMDGMRLLLLVNPTETEQECVVDGVRVRVPALNACCREL